MSSNPYWQIKDPNKIPSTTLIPNLWTEKINYKWYSQCNDQTLVISSVKQQLSLDTLLFT